MPVGQLYINGKDAYVQWGVSFSDTALAALMTPTANKDYIVNESRLEHGQRLLNINPKTASREVTLEMHITAKGNQEFLQKYSNFCQELAKGQLNIETSFQPNVVYKMYYVSCAQFSELYMRLAKFQLKLKEPNCNDREEDEA